MGGEPAAAAETKYTYALVLAAAAAVGLWMAYIIIVCIIVFETLGLSDFKSGEEPRGSGLYGGLSFAWYQLYATAPVNWMQFL